MKTDSLSKHGGIHPAAGFLSRRRSLARILRPSSATRASTAANSDSAYGRSTPAAHPTGVNGRTRLSHAAVAAGRTYAARLPKMTAVIRYPKEKKHETHLSYSRDCFARRGHR